MWLSCRLLADAGIVIKDLFTCLFSVKAQRAWRYCAMKNSSWINRYVGRVVVGVSVLSWRMSVTVVDIYCQSFVSLSLDKQHLPSVSLLCFWPVCNSLHFFISFCPSAKWTHLWKRRLIIFMSCFFFCFKNKYYTNIYFLLDMFYLSTHLYLFKLSFLNMYVWGGGIFFGSWRIVVSDLIPEGRP